MISNIIFFSIYYDQFVNLNERRLKMSSSPNLYRINVLLKFFLEKLGPIHEIKHLTFNKSLLHLTKTWDTVKKLYLEYFV